ncbi:MAG: hypothetical protein CR988_01515 [Treponema sp.]|nr:MAG: hypothetical protein CR988_01515 [Treponema sp.]
MHLTKIEGFSKKVISVLEVLIALILGVAVVVSIPSLFWDIISAGGVVRDFDYTKFGEFLKHVLSIIVGIELIVMIITRSHESILTLTLFVIARKMLVYAETMVDILLCVVSIAVIFAVIKFLANDDKVLAKFDNTFSASMQLEKLNREYKFNLPVDLAHTLGGLVYMLAHEKNIDIKTDAIITDETHTYKIAQATDGVIERVHISVKK